MNTHNEQHDPACIAAYEQLFQADSRDPSQAERLAVWSMSWNAARDAQPAAAQEAVGEVSEWDGSLCVQWVPNYEPPVGTKLYAAPVTAPPADTWFADQLTAMGEVIPLDSTPAAPAVTDPVAAYERELAAGATHEHALHAICTPAAPGIDLADVSLAAQMLTWGREEGLTEGQITEIDAHAQKLFALTEQCDASPKTFQPTRTYSLDILGNPMRQYEPGKWESARWPSDASPKGGSEAINQLLPPHAWPQWADRHVWDANGEGWFYGAIVEGGGEGLEWNYELQPSGIAMPPEHDWRVPVLRTKANSHGAGDRA